ncbi:hypothetical protein [Nocardia sp. MH4]|uniref:hypothetical protein n=1 Tax=Nocardia sp. MH4 TaxID=1768677 RepID=UPI001C500B4F|nr:hypothetical protein [Nocardia sp. MH4]
MPWFDRYEAAPGRPTGLHVLTGGMTVIPEPADDPEPVTPVVPGLLALLVSLIARR